MFASKSGQRLSVSASTYGRVRPADWTLAQSAWILSTANILHCISASRCPAQPKIRDKVTRGFGVTSRRGQSTDINARAAIQVLR